MYLPEDLEEFRTELAGQLILEDEPGDRVKQLRNRFGFTQKWLAEALDMRRESLSRVESGHVDVSPRFVREFTRVMTLARGVREHAAEAEVRETGPDERKLARWAKSLGFNGEIADEIILQSMINYGKKREEAVSDLGLEG